MAEKTTFYASQDGEIVDSDEEYVWQLNSYIYDGERERGGAGVDIVYDGRYKETVSNRKSWRDEIRDILEEEGTPADEVVTEITRDWFGTEV